MFVYGLAGHAGDWRREQTDWQGQRLNQPLIAFETTSHAGPLGKTFSILNVSSNRVRVMALKKAERTDDLIVRVVELDGKAQHGVHIRFPSRLASLREVNGQELPSGGIQPSGPVSDIVANFTPYETRTFAVKLTSPSTRIASIRNQTLVLPYDHVVTSKDNAKSTPGFDSAGRAIPAEMLPSTLDYAGVHFALAADGKPNALVARGQNIALSAGKVNRVYVLAASSNGDQKAMFRIGDKPVDVTVQDWGGYVGQWDNRIWKATTTQVPPPANAAPGTPPTTRTNVFGEMRGLTPGFIKTAPIAWFSSHRHTGDGENEPYSYSYLFAYVFDVPANATSLTLPNNDKIRIMAITVSDEPSPVRAAQALYDVVGR